MKKSTKRGANPITTEDLMKEIARLHKGYQKIVDRVEKAGLENLGSEDAEYYGAYLGKVELCEYLLNKFKK